MISDDAYDRTYVIELYNYLRPGSSGGTLKNIKCTLKTLEKISHMKFDVEPWENIRYLFNNSPDNEANNEIKRKLINDYRNKSLMRIPRSKTTLAKEIWKMLIADDLTSKGIFRCSPTLDTIKDESTKNMYYDSEYDFI
ncbi:hypothetical protein TVAG_213530 [Trichomonas vaginalis G3]|uniref:Uncharacterized protein n=1 Tax=Trichomonas vaginalis (strain ATCC PRA-98 / G3) TaxID=412133 RepID=A2EYT5_TRIV3|nr:hypothetical protein TVAGG3_0254290 [Trichomonas vaginalis G3]EAY02154.1 hypothetical protein TVAG_213530 [Trichomonas vaginalis G3]KAI5554251.1 hypothetical protein TVAGG3_0254290 [Trichomonas vaginalis G3]|eukprot:XP_001330557.1 hypothetical protein [Trichomonas vaginalis G3]